MKYVVQHKDGRLACQGWRGAPGSGFIWQAATLDQDYVLKWSTYSGASRFADMNGGKARSISELSQVQDEVPTLRAANE